jgi:hypothetical protein
MIQYSSINDAWGNKEMYKKNTINNIDTFIQQSPQKVETFTPQQLPQKVETPQQLPQKVETFTPQQLPQKVETFTPQQSPQKVETFTPQKSIQHHEHFDVSSSVMKTCSFAEHLKSCEHCRNSLSEYFENDSPSLPIDIFGFKITKEILNIIFIIIIVLIFIIILSTINVSLNDTRTHMKYYMVPQMPNVSMRNIPFYN